MKVKELIEDIKIEFILSGPEFIDYFQKFNNIFKPAKINFDNIIILDTDTLHYELIENPYAYNFYKLQVNTEADLSVFNTLKNNAVVSIKCEQQLIEKTKHVLSELSDKIIDSRIILVRNIESVDSSTTELDLSVDHLARFIECCKASIEDSKLLEEELSEICK